MPTDLDFTRFFALDTRHVAIVHVEPGARDSIVRADSPRLVLRAKPSLLAWVHEGMDHIYTGRDHISFVLALLLVVMLVRKPDWQLRRPVATLRATATVITAFTIAHSVSLISASLGWVHLPSRFVESMIALSIAYTAAENIVLPDVPEIITPIIYALPIQMLAYFTAVFMGTDVDQPRNLAKSVTVE